MAETFTPLLTTTDWNAEWKQLQKAREHFDDPAVWDARAKSYPTKHGSQDGYVKRFLELAAIKPGETVLDMGCGTGAIATPLALEGHEVYACDFSSGMLQMLKEDQASLGITHCKVMQMSWSEDWASFGLGPDSVDVAVASRSIATYDLEESLRKLIDVARRRICFTLPCGPSPKVDRQLTVAAGIEPLLGNDLLYAFNILASMGQLPEVAYIPSTREESFATREEALESYLRVIKSAYTGLVDDATMKEVPERLERWLDHELVETPHGVKLKEPRVVTWAFIACSY